MKSGEVEACPCGSRRAYGACCEPLHRGQVAPTAEALMRARYSAYALRLNLYLLATWHASTRPRSKELDVGAEATRWLGLEVLRTEPTGPDQAVVEFIARYRVGGGRAERQHEVSRFVREHGAWYYVDGEFPD